MKIHHFHKHFNYLPNNKIWTGRGNQNLHIDGLVQDWSISIANTMGILQSCTNPWIWCFQYHQKYKPLKWWGLGLCKFKFRCREITQFIYTTRLMKPHSMCNLLKQYVTHYMSSFLLIFYHWLHWKSSYLQLLMQLLASDGNFVKMTPSPIPFQWTYRWPSISNPLHQSNIELGANGVICVWVLSQISIQVTLYDLAYLVQWVQILKV